MQGRRWTRIRSGLAWAVVVVAGIGLACGTSGPRAGEGDDTSDDTGDDTLASYDNDAHRNPTQEATAVSTTEPPRQVLDLRVS